MFCTKPLENCSRLERNNACEEFYSRRKFNAFCFSRQTSFYLNTFLLFMKACGPCFTCFFFFFSFIEFQNCKIPCHFELLATYTQKLQKHAALQNKFAIFAKSVAFVGPFEPTHLHTKSTNFVKNFGEISSDSGHFRQMA